MKKGVGQALFCAGLAAAFVFLVSCIQSRDVATLAATQTAAATPATLEPAAGGDVLPEADPYAEPVAPLTVRQCGQCHPTIYNALREEGGKHRFACQGCHETFHVADQQEAMPLCRTCHDEPHVALEKFSQCLSCHEEPHAPLRIGLQAALTDGCGDCHAGPATDLRQAPSAHTELGCVSCHHDRHGLIPTCLECHQPHFASQPAPDCLSCHRAHQPTLIVFGAAVDARTCDHCHAEVYRNWSATPSRHADVNCAVCHGGHALVPNCTECHPAPHSEKILAAYPRCLTCHLDAHNPPVKRQ